MTSTDPTSPDADPALNHPGGEWSPPRARARATLLVTSSFFWFAHYTYVPILTPYAEHLGGSFGLIGFVVSAYGFSQLVLRLPLGIYSDRIGRRKPFVVVGLFAAGLAGICLALSPNPESMVGARLISGVSACAWVAFTVLYPSYLPPGRTTKAIGELSFVNGVSIMTASLLGGWLADVLGWTAPFWAASAFGFIGFLLALSIHEAPAVRTVRRMSLLTVARYPGLLWASIASALGLYTVFATSFGFLPNYAVTIGATKTQLGLLSTVTLLFSSAAGLLVGTVTVPRLGARRAVVLSYLTTAVTIFLTPHVHTVYLLFLLQAVTGLARGTAHPVMMSLAIHGLEDRERATAMGFYQAVYAIGMMLGPIGAGFIGERTGYVGLFTSTAVVALIAACASLKLPKE
jgi:MFS family permease